ncbi:MAG: RluA family pseudouridine synthase [Chlamydiales bacterium]
MATLFEALIARYPDSSKRTLRNWLKWGRVLHNGRPETKANLTLEESDTVALKERENAPLGIPILYRDDHILVIDKPAGLLSVPAANAEHSALSLLCAYYHTTSLYPVHRIDQGTSGVLLFARNKEIQRRLGPLFTEHSIDREYIAIVEGRMIQQKGTWQSYLKELDSYNVIETDPTEGRIATTHFELLRYSKNYSYIKLKIDTGRKHQIRVHCKKAGHPILGDKRYGLPSKATRLFLHSYLLRFTHPVTKKIMSFIAPPPQPFKKLGFTF